MSGPLATDEPLQRLEPVARDALAVVRRQPDAELTLLNISENATYAVDDLDTGRRTVLRVNRPGYHTRAAIESELAWIAAICAKTAWCVRRRCWRPRRSASSSASAGTPDGEARHAVHVRVGARHRADAARTGWSRTSSSSGAITARLHEHARQLAARRPASPG